MSEKLKRSPKAIKQRREYAKAYYQKHKDDPEFKAKKIRANKRYLAKKAGETNAPGPEPVDEEKFNMTKEKWFELYGYEMGSTEGWQNWRGWDR